jgi:hypothetical protein
MSSIPPTADVQQKTNWEAGSIFFWVLVFAFLYYSTLFSSQTFRVQKVEPWLLAISIMATVFYSYCFIFGRDALSLKYRKLTISAMAFLTLSELFVCFILAILFVRDARDQYGSTEALASTLAVFDMMPAIILDVIYRGHALIVVSLLTFVDLIIMRFHQDLEKRERFTRLVWIIDVPTLVAFVTILLIKHAWLKNWTGSFDGVRFEAGAITFQLLAANFSIVAANILHDRQRRPPAPVAHPLNTASRSVIPDNGPHTNQPVRPRDHLGKFTSSSGPRK